MEQYATFTSSVLLETLLPKYPYYVCKTLNLQKEVKTSNITSHVPDAHLPGRRGRAFDSESCKLFIHHANTFAVPAGPANVVKR